MSAELTVTDLADLLGVNRRRIAKWRVEDDTAPATTVPEDWLAWLLRTARHTLAKRLQTTLAARSPLAGGGGVEAPAGAADAGPVSPAYDPEESALAAPKDLGGAELAKWWQSAKSREQALEAQRRRQLLERDLIPIQDVEALLNAMAAAQIEALTDTVWRAMLPALDRFAGDRALLRALRQGHDTGVVEIRTRLAQLVAERMRAVRAQPRPRP